MKKLLSSLIVGTIALASAAAFATVGAVKVETFGNLSIQLGQVCDTFAVGSHPIGISCEIVADPGSGRQTPCGAGTCTPFGGIVRGDTIGAYCQDTGGNDVVVMCTSSTTPEPLTPAQQAQKGQ